MATGWRKAVAGLTGGGAAAAGVAPDRIVVGQTVGYESVWSQTVRNYADGLDAWISHVNAAGGVHGRRIEVRRAEDHFHADQAVANVRRLDGEVFCLAGLAGSGMVQAVLPVLQELKLPAVGAITGHMALRNYNRYLFHTRAGYRAEVGKMIGHLASAGIRRVAAVYQANDFGMNAMDMARQFAAAHGVEILAALQHDAEHWDAAAIATQIAAAKPMAVLMFTAAPPIAEIAKAYRAHTLHALPAPWVLSVASVPQLQELLAEDARRIAVTRVVPQASSTVSRLAQSYRALMTQLGREPNMSYEAVEGYITGRVLTEGLRLAGRELDRERFVDALEAAGEIQLDDFFLKYSPQSHAGPPFVDVSIVGRRAPVAA
jgi:branched-chain amino acid transport system substrate-binding protein